MLCMVMVFLNLAVSKGIGNGGTQTEECLRDLDSGLLQFDGIHHEATLDSIARAPNPWWRNNTMEERAYDRMKLDCPPLGLVLARVLKLDTNQKAMFNACKYQLNDNNNDNNADTDPGTADNKLVPLLLVIDPHNINDALATIRALSRVHGISSTRLHIALAHCEPVEQGWSWDDIQVCEGPTAGFRDSDIAQLLSYTSSQAYLSIFIPSDRMLMNFPRKIAGFELSMWHPAQSKGPEFKKIRALDALRRVLITQDHMHAVLLHAGSLPLPDFLEYHASSTIYAHRAAVLAVSSGAAAESAASNPHACRPDHFTLSDQLPRTASIGISRSTFIQLYTTLHEARGLSIEDSLEHVQKKHSGQTFFLLPPRGGSVHLEQHDTLNEGKSAEDQARLAQQDHMVHASEAQLDHSDGKKDYNSESGGDDDVRRRSSPTSSAADETCQNANGIRCNDTIQNGQNEPAHALRYADLLKEDDRDALAAACAAQGWSVRAVPRRVYDCVNFFQEDKMLLLRMHELVRWSCVCM